MTTATSAGRAAGLMAAVTAVTAVTGWATLVVAARAGGAAFYADLAVLWAAYYAVAGVLAGLQSEVTRRAVAAPGSLRRTLATGAGLGAAVTAVAVLLVAWQGPLDGVAPALALAVGLLGLVGLVAALGLLAAAERWGTAALLLGLDALLRLAAVLVVAGRDDGFGTAAAVAVSWPSWVWLVVARRLGPASADGSTAEPVTTPLVHAMAATGLASVVVGGLPWLVSLTGEGAIGATHAGLLAGLVLFRSPLLALTTGVRPVLLRSVLAAPDGVRDLVGRVWVAALGSGAVLACVAALVGPWLVRAAFGDDFTLTRLAAASLVGSGAALVMATVSGIALLAVGAHRRATEGWALCLLATVGALLLPVPLEDRVALAALAGPLLAVAWHALPLARP